MLLLPSEARAHRHRAGAFGGYSWDKGSTLQGFQFSGEWMLQGTTPAGTKVTRPFSLFGDFGANWGSHERGDRTQVGLMGGLRARWPFGGSKKVVQPFAHLVLGFVHTQDSAPNASDSAWGPGAGFGVDVRLGDGLFLRGEFDYVRLQWSEGIARSYRRYSVGFDLRLGSY